MLWTGVIFGLLTTLTWSIGIFPFTQAARRLGVNPLNHFRLMLATVIIAVLCCIISWTGFSKLFSSAYSYAWFWLGLSGIIGLTIGDYFAFAMYAILGARIGSVLTTFAPAAALVLGLFILDEHISWIGIAGIACTMAGVIYLSLSRSERTGIPDHGHGSVFKGIIFGILAALCQGAGLVLAKKGFQTGIISGHEIQPMNATFIRLSVGTSSLILLTLFQRRWKEISEPILQNKNKGLPFAVAGTFFGPVAGVTLSLYTVLFIDPSFAQTIFSLVPVFALFIARIFLKEKISAKAIVGVCVAIAGVMILIWRDQLNQLF